MHVHMDNNWETGKNQQHSSWDEHKIMQKKSLYVRDTPYYIVNQWIHQIVFSGASLIQ